jgi:hypothetical protein
MNVGILEKLVKTAIKKFNFPDIKFDFVKIVTRDEDPSIIYLTTTPKMNEVPGGHRRHIEIYREVYYRLMSVVQAIGGEKDEWDVRNYYPNLDENMEKEKFPFSQTEKDGKKIRTFKKDVDSEELVWHRDREDRLVEILEGTDWELQIDNELPKKMKPGDKFIIPEGIYHRVKKGKDDLKISITTI